MREATGELNSTLVVVILAAGFSVFFFNVVWPLISDAIDRDTKCADAICQACDSGNDCATVTCTLPTESGGADWTNSFECVYKG